LKGGGRERLACEKEKEKRSTRNGIAEGNIMTG